MCSIFIIIFFLWLLVSAAVLLTSKPICLNSKRQQQTRIVLQLTRNQYIWKYTWNRHGVCIDGWLFQCSCRISKSGIWCWLKSLTACKVETRWQGKSIYDSSCCRRTISLRVESDRVRGFRISGCDFWFLGISFLLNPEPSWLLSRAFW